jgi:hypothetical protein
MATLIIMNSAVGFAAAVGQIESDLRWAIREAADIARALEGKNLSGSSSCLKESSMW